MCAGISVCARKSVAKNESVCKDECVCLCRSTRIRVYDRQEVVAGREVVAVGYGRMWSTLPNGSMKAIM